MTTPGGSAPGGIASGGGAPGGVAPGTGAPGCAVTGPGRPDRLATGGPPGEGPIIGIGMGIDIMGGMPG